jgi:crotonobetainyl-CoA:carnitine CoA-transferase CaiB-like acyl-CoA transferase
MTDTTLVLSHPSLRSRGALRVTRWPRRRTADQLGGMPRFLAVPTGSTAARTTRRELKDVLRGLGCDDEGRREALQEMQSSLR